MDLPRNEFKRALASAQVVLGVWSSLVGSYAVEVVAGAGFDWMMIDTEHSRNDLESVLAALQVVAAYPTHPVVRLPWNDMIAVKRYLDIGAQTLLIPQVSTADEARAAVAYTRYPPHGLRGVGGTTRATRFGRVKGYAQRAHEEICVLVQVESHEALNNIEAIAVVDGVDGIFERNPVQSLSDIVFGPLRPLPQKIKSVGPVTFQRPCDTEYRHVAPTSAVRRVTKRQ